MADEEICLSPLVWAMHTVLQTVLCCSSDLTRADAGHDMAYGFRGVAPIGRKFCGGYALYKMYFAGVTRMLCVR